ncbi:MAG: universal stress protein, partial [Rhodospirillales bacterium]|nr:universal stress protein [Rhodospirillales bacterium]
MADAATDPIEIAEVRKNRFRILVCVDGSDESYRGLRYAARLGAGGDADIIILYVRPTDQGLRSGGLQVRVARENMLNWGLELPGITYLKKGRDMLIKTNEQAVLWDQQSTHTDVDGDPLGDNKIEYRNENGKSIVLKLKTASSVAGGILDQYDLGPYNLIILGSTEGQGNFVKSLWDPAVAEKVAVHAPCSVCISRDLETGHGKLLCTDGSERAMDMVVKASDLAKRDGSKVSVMSVSLDESGRSEAQSSVDKAAALLRSRDIEPTNLFIKTGNPIEEIIKAGM